MRPSGFVDLAGPTALVTGATDGIGKEVARGLLQSGARVILTARDAGRGAATRDELANSTGSSALDVRLVDFSQQSSIREFAQGVAAAYPTLDILVNNAGGWFPSRRESADGIELTWATNMLGYFLTTNLLLDRLKAAPSARIVNVASELARGLDLDDVEFKHRSYSGVAAYAQSKQANRMWTWALARRLEGSGVTANALHPGGVATGIFSKGGGLLGAAAGLFSRLAGRTPRKGADTALWLAASADVAGRSGLFFVDRKERRCAFRDREQEERLWALCERMTARK